MNFCYRSFELSRMTSKLERLSRFYWSDIHISANAGIPLLFAEQVLPVQLQNRSLVAVPYRNQISVSITIEANQEPNSRSLHCIYFGHFTRSTIASSPLSFQLHH